MSPRKTTRTIRQSTRIPAPPGDVYEAFLKPGSHSAFTGAKATCEMKVGGKFTAYDGYIFGKILELDPGRRIVQEWQTTEWPPDCPPSIAEFVFEESKGGTQLTMVQTSVPTKQADAYRQGWIDYYWDPLKEYFQNS